MKTLRKLLLCVCLSFLSEVCMTKAASTVIPDVQTSSSPKVQENAVRNLIRRLLPFHSESFKVKVDFNLGPKDQDSFELKAVNRSIQIIGSSGVAVAWGFHYYLKSYCGCQVSWSGVQLNLPELLPKPETPVVITSNDKFTYYMNVCTLSYSTVWWNWTRWEKELDWMALNRINLPLAFVGQEIVWKRLFLKLGFEEKTIDEYITGPAFLAWNRMGNVQQFGGPLPSSWHEQQRTLQHQILNRMREFGMFPVLPAFSGHVPPTIKKLFPSAVVSVLPAWSHFSPPYSCTTFLEPSDPLFRKFGAMFLQEYIAEFGTDHVYNTDLFNEMNPPSGDLDYIKASGKAVFQSMLDADQKAIWIMQGWMFSHSQDFWTRDRSKALLTSVPLGRMIVLDLQSEVTPQFQRLESYYGQPFIWCMLHNFGGVLGLYGDMESVNKGPFLGRSFLNSTMIGTGIVPEGIEQNEVMYELMNEMSWRKRPVNLKKWVSMYAYRRYGKVSVQVSKAWKLLKRSVFNCTLSLKDHGRYVIVQRPSLHNKPFVWFSPEDVFTAWQLFVLASKNKYLSQQENFRYDLVDVTREALQLLGGELYQAAVGAYRRRNIRDLRNISITVLDLLEDFDKVLASDKHFLLGNWIESAKSLGTNVKEKKLYEYNARNQITLWGPNGEILDYANKQWAGLIQDYYLPRWKLFFTILQISLQEKIPFKTLDFRSKVFQLVEEPFTYSTRVYPTSITGDSVKLSADLYKKYLPWMRSAKHEVWKHHTV